VQARVAGGRFVVPVFRTPGVALFAVKEAPTMRYTASEMVAGVGLSDSAAAAGIRFTGNGGLCITVPAWENPD